MSALLTLVKIQFAGLINSAAKFGGRRGRAGAAKKGGAFNKATAADIAKKTGAMGPLLIFFGIFAYIGVVYGLMLYSFLAPVNALDIALALMAVIAVMLCIMFMFFNGAGFLFGGKDNDFLLSMPVSTFFIMLSKTLALYLEGLLFSVAVVGPSVILFFIKGFGGAAFVLRAALGILFLPFLPVTLSVLFGQISAVFTRGFKHKNLFNTLLSFAFLAFIMVGSFQINGALNALILNQNAFREFLARYLPPLSWFVNGAVNGHVLQLLAFVAAAVMPFLLVLYIFSFSYKKTLTMAATSNVTFNYRLGRLQAHNAFSALFNKEVHRFFGTTSYVLNCGVGILMSWGALIYLYFFAQDQVFMLLGMEPALANAVPALAIVTFAFLLFTVVPAAASISLEGNRLWILKEAPVAPATVFFSKIALNTLLCLAAALPVAPVLYLCGLVNPLNAALIFAVLLTLCGFIPVVGLCSNLLLPKLDVVNETAAIKNSGSVLLVTFGGMLLTMAFSALYVAFFIARPFYVFAILLIVIFVAATAALSALLRTWGVRRFLNM